MIRNQLCRVVLLALCTVAASAWQAGASAQPYPNRPVKIVVALPAGQATDIIGRVIADELGRSMGQPFVVENRPGAGGTVGAGYVAKAAPDGYTLIMASSGSHAIAPGVYAQLPYDAVRDFAPVSNLVLVIQTLVASPSSGLAGVRDFIAKGRTVALNHAWPGSGTTSHLTMELLRGVAGLPLLTHIPFKGSPEAQTQIIGGTVDVMFDAMPGVLANIKAGKLKALGVAYRTRSPLLPDVPTFAEQGWKDFEAVGWAGLAAPAGTPAPILERLNAAVRRSLEQPAVNDKLVQLAFTPAGGTREEFGDFMKSEVAKWGAVIRQAKVKAD